MNANMPLVDRPDLDRYLATATLTNFHKDMILEFAERGYVVLDLGIDNFDQLADKIVAQLASLYRGGHRIQDAWRISEEVKALACNKIALDTLRLLYGREPVPFQTLNFDVGTQQKTHSDTIHFHCFPQRFMAGVWVALENTDENNGPLHYYPGSHKLPIYTLDDVGVAGSLKRNYDFYQSHYEPFIEKLIFERRLNKAEAHLKRGQALIWSANLLHGGSPIRQEERTRHSQVTHYYFEDCIYYSPLWSDLALRKIYYRSPFNIATNQPVHSTYCGANFHPPLAVQAKEWVKSASRYVFRSK